MEGVAHINENLQGMYVYIIPLINSFTNMEGVAERKDNCDVCVCILFLWSPISPIWWGLLTEMRIAMSVYVYYSLDHLFHKHGGVALRKENYNVCMCILFPSTTISPNMEGVAHINENCNVCMCILSSWSPIFPAWSGLLRELRIAMSVCVYYSLDHLFSREGWGCSQNLELQCLYVYIIPLVFPQAWGGIFREMRIALSVRVYYSLDHLFPQHACVAHRNENCNVCTCILFPWLPIFQTWRGMLREIRIPMSVCAYYSVDHLFPQTWRGLLT